MKKYYYTYYTSPLGIIEIAGDTEGIAFAKFVKEQAKEITDSIKVLQQAAKQFDEYFNNKRKEFDLKLNPQGTSFQKKVWEQLLEIPYGKTFSYLDIAKKIDNVNSTRAVGNANGLNPIAIIVPCHRIIGSDGKLVGYSGELWRKKWLLDYESKDNPVIQPKLF